MFLVKLDPAGAHVWSQRFGDERLQDGWGVAVSPGGVVALVGDFSGSIDLGGGALASAGGDDTFVATFAGDGTHRWSLRLGGTSGDFGRDVAFSPSGEVVLVGSFIGEVDGLGCASLSSTGYDDALVAKHAADGGWQWARGYGSENAAAHTVAVDADGSIVFAGDFSGELDLGGEPLNSIVENPDLFVARLDPAGDPVWSLDIGSAADTWDLFDLALTPGQVLACGMFKENVAIGGENLLSPSEVDAFVARYDASGGTSAGRNFAATDEAGCAAVAAGPDGAAAVTGFFSGTIEPGGASLSGSGNSPTTGNPYRTGFVAVYPGAAFD